MLLAQPWHHPKSQQTVSESATHERERMYMTLLPSTLDGLLVCCSLQERTEATELPLFSPPASPPVVIVNEVLHSTHCDEPLAQLLTSTQRSATHIQTYVAKLHPKPIECQTGVLVIPTQSQLAANTPAGSLAAASRHQLLQALLPEHLLQVLVILALKLRHKLEQVQA